MSSSEPPPPKGEDTLELEAMLEEGSLQDESQDTTAASGLPDRYLLPPRSPSEREGDSQCEDQFKNLTIEDTLEEGEKGLPLRVDTASQEVEVAASSSGLIFSPGGSQAYVIPSEAMVDPGRGERPTTVGQSDDSPSKAAAIGQFKLPKVPQAAASEQPPQANRSSLHHRLEDLKSSLDMASAPSDVPSTAESSPRALPRLLGGATGREQFLKDPDNFQLSETESLPSPHTGRSQLTDRATSPSVASVVSMASSTASGLTTGRRNLEWDSGADLGYLGDVYPQKEAAASLSTLEKLAIGNYSSYLRSEPEGKPTGRERAAAAAGAGKAQLQQQPPLLQSRQTEEDMRRHRLHKFADSLMRQRELRRMTADASASSSPARGRRRSKSRDKSGKSTPDSSPSHRSTKSSRERRRSSTQRSSPGQTPMKSVSLTDLQAQEVGNIDLSRARNYRSNSDVTQYSWLASNSLRHFLYASEEPSSCSSTGTVVPLLQEGAEGAEGAAGGRVDLQGISTDPSSLPPHLQGLFQPGANRESSPVSQDTISAQTLSTSSSSSHPPPSSSSGAGLTADQQQQQQLHSQASQSQSSLHSRQSASRSFETVINVNAPPKRPQKNRWVTKDNLHSDSVDDTEEELEPARQKGRGKEKDKDGSFRSGGEGREEESDDVGGARALPPDRPEPKAGKRRHVGAPAPGPSGASSVPTTSDEESKQQQRRQERRSSRARERLTSTNTATSTLESAQIDRAKSFEYFPGEHFPIQENSSSYEYLPGHLVTDRPGTVVSNYQNEVGDEDDDELNLSGIGSLSRTESTSSDLARAQRLRASGGARRRIDLEEQQQQHAKQRQAELQGISDEVTERSRDLLDAHLRKTREEGGHFYKKMKRYISYVATASETPEDSRKKQEILDKLLVLMTKQESRMLQQEEEEKNRRRSFSGQKARKTQQQQQQHASETEGDESEPATRALGAESVSFGGRHTAVTLQDNSTNTPLGMGLGMGKSTLTEPSSASSTLDSTADKTKTPSGAVVVAATGGDNIMLHQKRIEQMRVLRKEIKKLEKLEYAHLGKALQSAGGGLTFLGVGGPSDFSDESSIVSTSTCLSEQQQQPQQQVQVHGKLQHQQPRAHHPKPGAASKAPPSKSSATARLGVEGKSTSGSDSKQQARRTVAPSSGAGAAHIMTGTFTRNSGAKGVGKSRTFEGRTQQRPEPQKGLGGRPQSRADEKKKGSKSAKARAAADFGQTYPTPRDLVDTSAHEGDLRNKAIQTENFSERSEASPLDLDAIQVVSQDSRTTTEAPSSLVLPPEPAAEPERLFHRRRPSPEEAKPKKKKAKKPLAYYLPVTNESPIRIGQRLLREQQQQQLGSEEGLGKENRSILANYMAGLDAAAVDLRKRRSGSRQHESSVSSASSEATSALTPQPPATLTLRDALAAKRPDFLAAAGRRVYLLQRARQQRLEYEARVRQWLEKVSVLPAAQRRLAQPDFQPPRVERVFDYREMVESTRRRYQRLPEVRNRAYERKKKTSYTTNRMMRDMYKTRLQENVLRGRVTINHHRNVVANGH